MKVLLIEDDVMLGRSMERGLRLAGFSVDWALDGLQGQTALREQVYEVLLLDIALPGLNGLQLLQNLRATDQPVPVLVVSASSAVGDRVAGLNLGADDYLTKPFDLDELVARVHALARRHSGRAQPELQLGRLVMRPLRREALLDNQPVSLATREYDLLLALMDQPGTVMSREQLEQRLYGWQEEVASNAVEVHVHHLRRKLGSAWIKNVRGVGYKLVAVE